MNNKTYYNDHYVCTYKVQSDKPDIGEDEDMGAFFLGRHAECTDGLDPFLCGHQAIEFDH